MNRIILVQFDQLNRNFGAIKSSNPGSDLVVFIESERMRTGRKWHKQRLFFLTSSARHFAKELQAEGFEVKYLKATSTVAGLTQIKSETGISEVVTTSPNSFQSLSNLSEIGVSFLDSDFFLTPREIFQDWASAQKSFTMENFYRMQRERLNILVQGGKPIGGKWNFDSENRLPPPKNHDWGPILEFEFDEIDREVIAEIPDSTWGNIDHKYWATSHDDALKQLAHFLEFHFADFGPFEDAMPVSSWAGHHSLLSPYLNNGLLHPIEVLSAVRERFERGGIPISSYEGFVRQIIGWREYVMGMYWYLGPEYRDQNGLVAKKDLLPLFSNPEKTQMNCVKTIVGDISKRGWTHHIPRLMVLSNLALLTGVEPIKFLDWMREVFVDAAEWVMVPNVIGMGVHADNGVLMTKPYAAGGAYLSKMGQYCKSCIFDPKQRAGSDACPFTTLYWDFLDRHLETFKNNHRMFQQISGLHRLKDLPEVRTRAKEVISSLENGNL